MPVICRFHLIQQAIQYARQHGGWIAKCCDGQVWWFDASVYTQTPIIKFVTKLCKTAEIGTWPMFDAVTEEVAFV